MVDLIITRLLGFITEKKKSTWNFSNRYRMEDKPGRLWRHSQSEGVKPPANSKPLNPTALWFAIVVQLLLLLQLRIRKSEQLAEMRDLNSVLSLLLTVFTRRLCFFSPTPLWCYRYNLLPFKYISPSEWKLMQQTQNVFYFFLVFQM